MDLNQRFPAIADLKARARARIPHFVWEYLDSATGTEATLRRNRAKLDEVLLRPSILHGEFAPDLTTELFGQRFPLPFGVSPIGMSGLIWPDAERLLAAAAGKAGLPYSMSTVASQTPEFVAPVLGQHGWFQMYPPRDPEIRKDMLRRAKDAGLLGPDPDRRRAGRQPAGASDPLGPDPAAETHAPALRPGGDAAGLGAWAPLRMGMPRMRLMDGYADNKVSLSSTAHIGYLLRTSPDWDYLKALRDAWEGPLIVKGVLNADDAARLQDEGADAIWVSNHAGRQFDAAPATIEALPAIRAATTLPVIFDSGIEGGLDILRAIALGADFRHAGAGLALCARRARCRGAGASGRYPHQGHGGQYGPARGASPVGPAGPDDRGGVEVSGLKLTSQLGLFRQDGVTPSLPAPWPERRFRRKCFACAAVCRAAGHMQNEMLPDPDRSRVQGLAPRRSTPIVRGAQAGESPMAEFKKVLIANRGEIAIRVMRAATELGKRTVAVYAEEDKLSLHRFKADEAYRIGEGLGPVAAYLSIPEIIRVATECGADAIHPGYGLLSENPDFVEACAAAGITFIGPKAETMRALGDKASARRVAVAAGVPVIPATEVLGDDFDAIKTEAAAIGYPLMLKASWGGGGRGMRPITKPEELVEKVREGRREAEAAFGNGEGYLEKMILRARHVEVQILGDSHGNIYHLYERDCTVQRRNQKVVERAPAPYLTDAQRAEVCELGRRICAHVNYECAGTVEFLMDMDDEKFYFIEVNPRVQVEHTVTEEVTGIDIVQAQINIAEGKTLAEATGVGRQQDIVLRGHALQCRVTTEDPQNNFIPDYGRITAYRSATGMGIRLDGGTAYAGGVITRYYDSLLVKVTAWAPTPTQAIARMDRALREFRIRGRQHQHRLRREPPEAPDLPRQHLHDEVHRHDARPLQLQEAPRPGDEDPDLHRRHHGERAPRDRRPPETARRGARARSRRSSAPPPPPRARATFWKKKVRRPSPTGWRARRSSF